MRFWLNIIWLVFGGFVLFLNYIFFGLLACIFIVTIPAGIASFANRELHYLALR